MIYLFKLLRLLHDRIGPTVELLRKKPPTLKPKKSNNISTSSLPPMSVPSWCLNQEALKRLNRSSVDIPVYDYDTDDNQHNTDNDIEDEEIPNRTNSNRRKKRKTKKKQKRNKKHKSK